VASPHVLPSETGPVGSGPAGTASAVGVLPELEARFPDKRFTRQPTADGVPTLWVDPSDAHEVLDYLKNEAYLPYRALIDLAGIDERRREHREGQPPSDFSVVYYLTSYGRNADVRLKVALLGDEPSVPTVTDLWEAASWYEREVWDMFGVGIDGHPNLRRLLMPPWWEGHPLRKEHPARGSEYGPFVMSPDDALILQEQMTFRPEEWGLEELAEDPDIMFLNVGPQHGGTHGVVHITVGLRDEEIVACVVDIGFHHRAAEKTGERQTWHTFIPYTDRVDYLGGVTNNLAYVMAVEQLAGIEIPPRAEVIRVMMSELYRINSHLLYVGTYAQDIGALSPVFYMFSDREVIHDITEAICGGRMHPNWFRIGGVAEDLPNGWEQLIRDFLDYLPPRLNEYDKLVLDSPITKQRAVDVGTISLDDAIEWGVTGPNLRAAGMEWDYRKKRPYSGYDRFEFDIPTGSNGDSYDRMAVRMEEMRQSLRIIRQCLDSMPSGPYKALHPLATPPMKEPGTMHHIETLINHFLGVSWGPVMPPGESFVPTEGIRGTYGYYVISDGDVSSYRTHIRTPSFPHLQVLPLLCVGLEVADLITILGSLDFVMADVDR
jgi:NADH-quinone oxidoreductase subunit C/D